MFNFRIAIIVIVFYAWRLIVLLTGCEHRPQIAIFSILHTLYKSGTWLLSQSFEPAGEREPNNRTMNDADGVVHMERNAMIA